ncbi:unnamed protein product [Rotaria sp. Silwood1]|nr:unnamed protein product [Rotaria sp. Silwood1]
MYLLLFYRQYYDTQYYDPSFTSITDHHKPCYFKPSINEFIFNYKTNSSVQNQPDITRVEPTIQRIRNLLEIIRSKEDKYQSLLENFDVFDMLNPDRSLKPYSFQSNIDEIKFLYNRFIKLMPDKKQFQIDQTFIDYLRNISNYLLDGLRNQRTNTFQVSCVRKPVFVLACDHAFFDGLQGAIHTLDTYWSDHRIIFYDLVFTDRWFNYPSADIIEIFCVWLIKQSKKNVSNENDYKLWNKTNKAEICIRWTPWRIYDNYRCHVDSDTKCLSTNPFVCEKS